MALTGFRPAARGRMWRLTGPNLNAANHVGQPQQVSVIEANFVATAGELTVAPYSVERTPFLPPRSQSHTVVLENSVRE